MEVYSAILAGLGGMLGWGLADLFAKKTVGKTSAINTFLYSHIFGAILLLIYLAFNWTPVNLGPKIILFLILFGIGDLTAYTLFYRGLQKGMVSVIGPIVAANGGVAVLVSSFLFNEAITTIRWMGLSIVFIGTVLISFQLQGISTGLSLKNVTKGLPEALTSLMIWGFFFPFWDWFLGQGGNWVISLTLVGLVSIIGALAFIYLSSRSKKIKTDIQIKERKVWFWLLLIGFSTTAASLSIAWGYRFTTVTSVVAVLSTAATPPTVILARIFLKEKLAFNQIIGVAAIIGGLIILAL